MKKIALLFLGTIVVMASFAQEKEKPFNETTEAKAKRMQWWQDARFGMFIHFGVYAQFAGRYHGHEQKVHNGEWLMNRMKVPVQEYKDTAKNFNPIKFDADEWVRMAKDAGMKYIVITAKHHDGFALFNTKASDWNIVKATPYGKDILKPLADACKKHGIRLGFYYSQSQDWANPGGGTGRRPMNQGWPNPDSTKIDAYTLAHNGSWDSVQTTKSYTEYFRTVAMPQVKELLTNYGDIAVLWWDTPMNTNNPETKEMYNLVNSLQPGIIQNDRLRATGIPGDFATPEQKIPNLAELDGKDWETCMTMNDTWGYRVSDHHWKSSKELVQKLVDIASKGGNFLLNIGPQPDGSFPEESVTRLEDIGQWTKKYGEAIYGTHSNPINTVDWGRITAKDKGRGTTLYVSVFNWPADGKLKISGLKNKVLSAILQGSKAKLKLKQDDNGNLEISCLPTSAPDDMASVITLQLDGLVAKKIFEPAKSMKTGSID